MMPGLLAILVVVIALAAPERSRAQPVDINSMTNAQADDVMIDARQRVLYTYDNDFYDNPTCLAACADQWPPFEPAADDVPGAGFTLVHRPDGKWQWSYVGNPLYYSARDKNPYDLRGNGIDSLWHFARLPGGND